MQTGAVSTSREIDTEPGYAPRGTYTAVGFPAAVIAFYRANDEGTVL